MFERLQKKWKVKGWQFVLIIATFAIGGSATGFVAKKLMPVFAIGPTWLWILVYILVVTLLWPLAVLLVSIPLGQFPFFSKYIRKIGRRMGIGRSQESLVDSREPGLMTKDSGLTTHLAIFASGAGSNAQKIIDHFRNHSSVKVSLIVCNNPLAGVLQIANTEGIPVLLIEKEKFLRGDAYIKEIKEHKISFIVLAGFLWKIPAALINMYPGRIINIHPALLPKYGGKGMYGQAVHQAVINAGENESGITIHYVDEVYDNGKTIFQARCPVISSDTAESLAQRIHKLEHEHYSKVIENIVKSEVG
jgi:formyltetrahydrofolate-dependent phosphoribosylglycinamide formyltransferase